MASINRRYIRTLRYAIQWAMLAFILLEGYRFALFVDHFMKGTPLVQRPTLVDGFLPLGGLMGMKHFFLTGTLDPVHPAATVILASALLLSVVLPKAFCGWLCPVGTISEAAFLSGRKLFGKNFRIHRFIDYPLRGIKYLLLGFFAWAILIRMPAEGIAAFTSTPYWKVAAVRMLHFFTQMSSTTVIVLVVLAALSLIYKNFWCRYLCPYGALTGLFGLLSPVKITRSEEHCIHCSKCTKSCPNLLDVERKQRVVSPECSGCMTCVAVCPSAGALEMKPVAGISKALHPALYAAAVLVLYFSLMWAAMATDNWTPRVTYEEYRQYVPIADRFGHP